MTERAVVLLGSVLALPACTFLKRGVVLWLATVARPPRRRHRGNDDDVTLLSSPSVAELYHGRGTVPFGTANAVLVDAGRALLAQSGGKLLRMPIAKELENPRVESVIRVAGGA